MISLTRLNGQTFVLNALLVETVESTPDTVITLTTGKKFIVRESVADVVERVTVFYAESRAIAVIQAKEPDE